MDSELEIIAAELTSVGGNPISIMKQALFEQKKQAHLPTVVSCQSCKNQKKCPLKDAATKTIQLSQLYPAFNQALGTDFYSQIATACNGFEVIKDPIFGQKAEN